MQPTIMKRRDDAHYISAYTVHEVPLRMEIRFTSYLSVERFIEFSF